MWRPAEKECRPPPPFAASPEPPLTFLSHPSYKTLKTLLPHKQGVSQWHQPKQLWELIPEAASAEADARAAASAADAAAPSAASTGKAPQQQQQQQQLSAPEPEPGVPPPAATAAAVSRPSRPPPKAPRLEALDDVRAWEIRASADGRPYFVCAELDVSSWLMPPCLQAIDRAVRPL